MQTFVVYLQSVGTSHDVELLSLIIRPFPPVLLLKESLVGMVETFVASRPLRVVLRQKVGLFPFMEPL